VKYHPAIYELFNNGDYLLPYIGILDIINWIRKYWSSLVEWAGRSGAGEGGIR